MWAALIMRPVRASVWQRQRVARLAAWPGTWIKVHPVPPQRVHSCPDSGAGDEDIETLLKIPRLLAGAWALLAGSRPFLHMLCTGVCTLRCAGLKGRPIAVRGKHLNRFGVRKNQTEAANLAKCGQIR